MIACGCNAGGMCGCLVINGVLISNWGGGPRVRSGYAAIAVAYLGKIEEAIMAEDQDQIRWLIGEAIAAKEGMKDESFWPPEILGSREELISRLNRRS